MILLDTNVVSELMRVSPDPAVEGWIADYPVEDLFFSAVGESELRYGAAIMPAGRRREMLVSDIAAIARSRGMAVATRNVRDFEDMGIDVFNPWDAT